MSKGFTRREFLKAAGATAGVAVAAGYSPFSYAANNRVRVGCIGTGGQGNFHLRGGLSLVEELDVVAVCDVYKQHLQRGQMMAGGEHVQTFVDYRQMLDEVELDAVVISTPQHNHYPIVMDALDAGKYVFCEKTLTYDIEEARNIVTKCHETGLFCQVGHQRRHNPQYNKAVWLAREQNAIGRIHHMTAQWHRNNDWRRPIPNIELDEEERQYIDDLERHLNWRLYRDFSGGLMCEFGTHQIDIFAWFLGAMPSKVSGYGGIDYWRDGRDVQDNVATIWEFNINQGHDGFTPINPRNALQDEFDINMPYQVRATYTSIDANAQRGANELIQGDMGTFFTSEMEGCYVYGERATERRDAGAPAPAEEELDADELADVITSGETLEGLPPEAYEERLPIEIASTKSANELQFQALADCIREGGHPQNNEMVGLMATIMGICGMEACRDNKEVDIDPALYTFDFPTPDPFTYEYWPDPEHEEDA